MPEVASVEEFLDFVDSSLPTAADHWFRGHSTGGWNLSASVFRSPARAANERLLLRRFIQEARRHVDSPPNQIWDWVFLAQHHQVPTRLLDWSEIPLVGLYFAAQDHLDVPGDDASARNGEVWMLAPELLNSRSGLELSERDLPMFDIDTQLNDYNPFSEVLQPLPVVAALAARNFRRISAQWGTFTVCNVDRPIDLLPDPDDFVASAIVPVSAKSDIRRQLARYGLEPRTIYPDLSQLGQHLAGAFT